MDSPYLTMAEKRDLLESLREMTKGDVLTVDDKYEICLVCLHACERELAKGHKKSEKGENE